MSLPNRKVAIIGSGLIGRAWAMIFSSTNYKVSLFDSNAELLGKARDLISRELAESPGRGNLSREEKMANIGVASSLEDCVSGAIHIQECVFENLALKQDVFKQIDEVLGENPDCTICSSTSVQQPSDVFAKVQIHLDQCMVAHPINPPAYVRLVELVPHPKTREDIKLKIRSLMDEVGQKPVSMERECSGFALNRLQYAVFQEAFRMVRDGIMTAEDVDTVVSEGLGPRYAFMGPWMTAHLNANGMSDYLHRYAEGIYKVSLDCQPLLKIDGEGAQKIIDAMMYQVPLEELDQKRAWRDRRLIELANLKDKLQKEGK